MKYDGVISNLFLENFLKIKLMVYFLTSLYTKFYKF